MSGTTYGGACIAGTSTTSLRSSLGARRGWRIGGAFSDRFVDALAVQLRREARAGLSVDALARRLAMLRLTIDPRLSRLVGDAL